jgi:hypothetical protein
MSNENFIREIEGVITSALRSIEEQTEFSPLGVNIRWGTQDGRTVVQGVKVFIELKPAPATVEEVA